MEPIDTIRTGIEPVTLFTTLGMILCKDGCYISLKGYKGSNSWLQSPLRRRMAMVRLGDTIRTGIEPVTLSATLGMIHCKDGCYISLKGYKGSNSWLQSPLRRRMAMVRLGDTIRTGIEPVTLSATLGMIHCKDGCYISLKSYKGSNSWLQSPIRRRMAMVRLGVASQ